MQFAFDQHAERGFALAEQGSMLDMRLAAARTPAGPTQQGLHKARSLPRGCSVELAVSALGSGSRVVSEDTVPFALWCVAQQPDDYQEAMWRTVSGLGDRDTACAMAGASSHWSQAGTGYPQAGWPPVSRWRCDRATVDGTQMPRAGELRGPCRSIAKVKRRGLQSLDCRIVTWPEHRSELASALTAGLRSGIMSCADAAPSHDPHR